MKNRIMSDTEAEELLKNSLIDGVKCVITRKSDTLLYQGKTMNFTPLKSGGVLVEVY